MIIRVDVDRVKSEAVVKIIYTPEEWRKLEEYYKQRGLQGHMTRNLFDDEIEAPVYRYLTDEMVLAREVYDYAYPKLKLDTFDNPLDDDINDPVISRSRLNVAIFRVIPTCRDRECVTTFTAPLVFINYAMSKVFKAVLLTLAKIMYGEGKKARIIVEKINRLPLLTSTPHPNFTLFFTPSPVSK